MTIRETTTKSASAGYKSSEVGKVPEEWDVKTLSEFGTFSKGKGIKRDDLTPDGVPCIRYGEIYTFHNDYVRSFNSHIPKEVAFQSKRLRKGDLLFAGSGETAEEIGKCVAFLSDEEVYAGGDIVIFSPDGQDSLYLGYLMNHPIVASQKARMGQGDAVVHIGARHLAKIVVPLPKKHEQTTIAKSIQDIDTLIENLEKLIAKKRTIKQGTMQELLTGKRRLPGYSRKWIEKPMAAIGTPYGGLSGKSKRDFGSGDAKYIPFLNIMNNPVIDPLFLGSVNVEPGERQNQAMRGDIFFNGSSETPDEVGMCSFLSDHIDNLYLNSFCFGFRLNKDAGVSGLYLSYYFRSGAGRRVIYSLGQGAIRYNLSKANFLKLEIPLPEHREQQEIAGTLSDMDAEVSLLERELRKRQAIRKGMMQSLLTGKIRLLSK